MKIEFAVVGMTDKTVAWTWTLFWDSFPFRISAKCLYMYTEFRDR